VNVWARVHKIDRVRPQPNGSAIVLVEDERNAAAMARTPGLSTLVAVARILNARRLLDARYGGKGEIRYATNASPPTPLTDAITRAGASIADRTGENVTYVGMPAAVGPTIDLAFSDLAHYMRTSVGAQTAADALRLLEGRRRKAAALDRETNPAGYWTAVFELAALAGELSRPRGGRWIDTKDTPVPFAIKFAEGGLANPVKLAIQIVEGVDPLESLVTESEMPSSTPSTPTPTEPSE
jgi:hypothetical protein